MATDLSGKPIGGHSNFKLNLQQKRQAALLYHWMSLDYLKGLVGIIDALIKGADVYVELAKQQGRDALLTNKRWGVRDTAASWSTNVFPALEDFRKSTIKLLAWRAAEGYCGTGAYQCGRMIDEFSSDWMTPDEQDAFKSQFQVVSRYAQFIDIAAGVGGLRHRLTDFTMALYWQEHAYLFNRLPKFRVRTDIEAVTGKRPLRTGVYVSQTDEFATLQFAWTGNDDGQLGDAQTLNDLGRRMVNQLGRDAVWTDASRMTSFAVAEMRAFPSLDAGPYTFEEVAADAECANAAMHFATTLARPCKWYYVEPVTGEYDDVSQSIEAIAVTNERLRCDAGQPCPREGYWSTPARVGSRRYFQPFEVMPVYVGDYGSTIWQWDEDQGA